MSRRWEKLAVQWACLQALIDPGAEKGIKEVRERGWANTCNTVLFMASRARAWP